MFLYVVFLFKIISFTFVTGLYNDINSMNFSNSWIEIANDWHENSISLGQLSAVAVDNKNNVIVFHRGDRVWDARSFSFNNIYNFIEQGPIQINTVIKYDRLTGIITNSWGHNKFYMPHGLSVDHQGNIWITDVALHQVFKFSDDGANLLLQLGENFVPGSDLKHFCKPTSVATMKNGDFFVADGYCNSRILKYSSEGKIIMHWGSNNYQGQYSGLNPKIKTHYSMAVPHALALVNYEKQLCVADRENGRILCFDSNNGTFVWMFQHPLPGTRLFSITYAAVNGGELFAVNGPSINSHVEVFVVKYYSNNILFNFGNLSNPHDVAVSPDGSELYVVELDPFLLHKYVNRNIFKPSSGMPDALQDEHISGAKWTKHQVSAIVGISVTLIIIIFIIYLVKKVIAKKTKDNLKSGHRNGNYKMDDVHTFQKLKDNDSDEENLSLVN